MQVHRIFSNPPNEYTNALLLRMQVAINFLKDTFKFKMQVGINYLQLQRFFSIFLLGRRGSVH